MSVHRLHNPTPFAAHLGFAKDTEGGDVAVALLKATFQFDTVGSLAVAPVAERLPIFAQDVFAADPAASSLVHACEVVPNKLGTDIAVNGRAYSYGKKETSIELRVGKLRKVLQVIGPRHWYQDFLGKIIVGPSNFSAVSVGYESAFGGVATDTTGMQHPFAANPCGRGFAMASHKDVLLPNLFYPGESVRRPSDTPKPAALGYVSMGWPQRARFAGTFDEAWRTTRRPLLPVDFNERYYNAVAQDQVVEPKLQGSERIELAGLHATAARLSFALPKLVASASFTIRDRVEELPMVWDAVLIEPDNHRLAITLRASLAIGYDMKLLRSVSVRCEVSGAKPLPTKGAA